MNDIRKHMDMLNEASLKDVAADVSNKAKAALGNKAAAGKEDSKRLAKYFSKSYEKWLGQTGGEPSEETLMKFFVSKIGFTAANARKIFNKAGLQDPTKMESLTEALKTADLNKAFQSAAQFAYEYDLVPDGDDDKNKDNKFTRRSKSDGDWASGSSRRYGSRSQSSDDILRGIRPKDDDDAKTSAKVKGFAHVAGLEDEHLAELLELVGATKGNYSMIKKISNQEQREDALEMLARMGYAYIRSQLKN